MTCFHRLSQLADNWFVLSRQACLQPRPKAQARTPHRTPGMSQCGCGGVGESGVDIHNDTVCFRRAVPLENVPTEETVEGREGAWLNVRRWSVCIDRKPKTLCIIPCIRDCLDGTWNHTTALHSSRETSPPVLFLTIETYSLLLRHCRLVARALLMIPPFQG